MIISIVMLDRKARMKPPMISCHSHGGQSNSHVFSSISVGFGSHTAWGGVLGELFCFLSSSSPPLGALFCKLIYTFCPLSLALSDLSLVFMGFPRFCYCGSAYGEELAQFSVCESCDVLMRYYQRISL